MGQLVDDLGQKTPGLLIKSSDWNDLVAAVETVEETLNQRIDDLSASVDVRFDTVDGQIQTLTTNVDDLSQSVDRRFDDTNNQIQVLTDSIDTLRVDLTALRNLVEPIIGQYYRVTMESTRVRYVIGELAEITARVTDLQGNPLDLSSEADRPWIDFVTAWGQMKPTPGFESRGGAGDKTISVRTNASGIAQVRLKSEHTEGFTDETEDDVAVSLTTTLSATSLSIADTILNANTPMEANISGAFRTLSLEYDRTDAVNLRSYVDTYYVQNATLITGNLIPRPINRWRDYRSTVLAFAKADSDPTTPDQSRGVSSIQVTFRDWISPWVTLEYLPTIDTRVVDIRDRFRPRITSSYRESVNLLVSEVKEIVSGKGLLAKQREYIAIQSAFDGLNLDAPPSFMPTLTKSFQDALRVQQTQDYIQSATIGRTDDETAFEILTEAIVGPDTAFAAVESQVNAVSQAIEGFETEVADLRNSVSFIDGRVDASLAEGGELQQVRSDILSVNEKVGALQNLNVTEVQTGMIELQGFGTRIQALERLLGPGL